MDDGIVLRADVFRPVEDGKSPVILTYGVYAKGLAYQEGYPQQWQKLVEDHPEILARSTNKYQAWEVTDPERWIPHGYVVIRVDSRGAGWSPPQKPFKVYTANALIEVLGTKFNIRSWKESNSVEVAVVDGKVALEISDNPIKQIILEKGFAGSLSSDGDLTNPERVDIDSYLSWMNGKISFDDVLFSEILAQVERWYDVRFSLRDSTFINDRLTVSINKNSLRNVLDVLTALTNTHYKKEGNIVILSLMEN